MFPEAGCRRSRPPPRESAGHLHVHSDECPMTPRVSAVLILICLSALAYPARAQEGNGQQAFRSADTNRDGLVDPGEFQTVRTGRFNDRDRNRDGFLGRDDLGGLAASASGGRAAQRLAELDLDGDDRVSRAEFSNHGRLLFGKADSNNDGFVSRAEIAALPH